MSMTKEGVIPVTDGLHLHYRMGGTGEETLLVPNAVWLEKALAPLHDGRRCVFYDLRSRGRSDRALPEHVTAQKDVEDLEAVRAALDLGPVTVLAHSYVTIVAALHAARNPGIVRRLVCVGILPLRKLPYYERGFPTSEQMLNLPIPALQEMRQAGLDRTDPARFSRAYMETVILARQFADPAKIPLYAHDAYDCPNEHPDHFIPWFSDQIFPSLGNWDFRQEVARVSLPTLIVQGDRERPVEAAREWVETLPNARLLIVPEAGHAPYVEQPEIFFPAVQAFLAGNWPDDARSG